jgi:hypothetical protein
VSATLRQACRGVWGGALVPTFKGCRGEIPPYAGVRGQRPREICFASGNMSHFCLNFHVHCWEVFRHTIFADGFLFLVKELGLLTNPGHWVRVLDVVGSYMYIVL